MSNLEYQATLIGRYPATDTMAELWRPLAQDAWQRCHDEARDTLTNLTPTELLAWAFHAVPDEARTWVTAAGRTATDDQVAHAAAIGARLPKTTKDLLMRLYKVADDRYLSFRELIAEAREGSTCGLALAEKNASKTSWYEDAAGAFINLRTPADVLVFRLASKQTKLSVRFDADGTAHVNTSARDRKKSKDADLAVVLPPVDGCSKVLLISHKYARVSGGHQDNQMADAVKYLSYASKSTCELGELTDLVREHTGDPDRTIAWEPALVTDGSYFAAFAAEGPQLHGTRNLFVGTTDDLVTRLRHVCTHLPDPAEPLCPAPVDAAE